MQTIVSTYSGLGSSVYMRPELIWMEDSLRPASITSEATFVLIGRCWYTWVVKCFK